MISSGWISLLKSGIRAGVRAKSRAEKREVTAEEILADLFNEMVMSGEVDGIKVVELIDKRHICGK